MDATVSLSSQEASPERSKRQGATHLLDLVKKKTKYRPSQSINLLLILTLNSFI